MQRPRGPSFPTALIVCGFCLLTRGVWSLAQVPAPGSTQPLPIATADAHPLSIDAEVTDKHGNFISGLQANDFTLLDNKQRAKIVGCREVDSRGPTGEQVHVVIAIDMINTDFTVVAREREQLGEFLRQDGGRLGVPMSIAVLTEKGLKMEKASTRDGNTLLAALDKSDSQLRIEGRTAGFYGAADRLNWSLAQLSQLAAFEATQPGRKLVFVISPGWPLLPWAGLDTTAKDRKWTFNSIVSLTNGLREAHVALYAINPFEIGRSDTFYYQNYLKGVTKANDAEYADLALQVLATHTGGLVEVTGMDIKGEINNAVRDAERYYTITFDARRPDQPDEYHELRLQVAKPGAIARTSSGYYSNTMVLASH